MRSVSAVKRVPRSRSISVATTRRPSAIRRAEANRSASGAMPATGFSGLPGETISQTSSSRSARRAMSATCRCPACAGLKDPPSSPMRRARESPNRAGVTARGTPLGDVSTWAASGGSSGAGV